jgi:hypothetical protein
MDDILIIILTLLFTIFAAINQKKKKQGQEEKEGIPWEEIFQGKNRVPVPAEEVIASPRKPQPKPVKKSTVVPVITEWEYPGEGLRNESVKMKTAQKRDDSFETVETESYLEGFSLKKAVIYSEILSPKYLD